jgi:hypothetical protein
LREQIEQAGGGILEWRLTNAHEYLLRSEVHARTLVHRIVFFCGDALFKFNPSWAARVFNDFVVCLVRF